MSQHENKPVEINDEKLSAVSGGVRLGENEKRCGRCGGIMGRKPGTSFYLCDNCGNQERIKR